MAGRGKPPAADEDADCVTQVELRAFTKNITEAINMNHDRYAATLEAIEWKISGVVDRLEALEIHMPPAVHELDDNEQDKRARCDEELWHRLHCNRQGMKVTTITTMITATRIIVILLPRLNLLSLLSMVLMMFKLI
jgi:hypothetical protein